MVIGGVLILDETINEIFKLLDKWVRHPKYQLERRADIFFAWYLPEIMKAIYDKNLSIMREHIIPEFPLRKGDSNESKNVDYAIFGEKTIYLVEQKTTMDNVKDIKSKDIKYLLDARKTVEEDNGMRTLMKNICDIRDSSKQFKKYDTLLCNFENNDMNKRINNINHVKILYLLPLNPYKHDKFKRSSIRETFKNNDINIVSFDEIKEKLPVSTDILAKRFGESLDTWSKYESDKIYRYPNDEEIVNNLMWQNNFIEN